MPLAYYSTSAEREFWTDHWGGHTVDELLAVARRSPLTDLVTAALPAGGAVLEAGCGLGQYVILLRERGWRAAGADWSVEALATCRRTAAVPLAAMDLGALALRDGAVSAYLSLGVLEHDSAGPDRLLAEARRVLAPGGTIVVSVPYVNAARRLAAPWIRRANRGLARAGAGFYQYAFTRAELRAALERHAFDVRRATPYDPARLLRSALRALRRHRSTLASRTGGTRRSGSAAAGQAGAVASGVPSAGPGVTGRGAGPTGTLTVALRALVRRVLYTDPALRALGHMILMVGVKR